MNMKFGVVAGAYVIENVHLAFGEYSTFHFICDDLGIDLSEVLDSDFESAAMILTDFINSANDDTGYTVSVWFD